MTDSDSQSHSAGPPEKRPARLLICDDQQLIRAGIRQTLRDINTFCVVGEAANGSQAVNMALELRPDIIVMDLVMPELDGIEATKQILAQAPGIRILGYSADPHERSVRQMLAAGARGYLKKSGDHSDLIDALTRVLAGELFISFQPDVNPDWPRPD